MDPILIFAGCAFIIGGFVLFWGCGYYQRRFHIYAMDLAAVQVLASRSFANFLLHVPKP
jgi:hypothetical protein